MIYANYTIVLKTLLDDPQSKLLIDRAMSTYPLYNYQNAEKMVKVFSRDDINKLILDHYKYREIGFETFGRFLDELEISLNEIMPYYNQLFASEDIINGLDNIFDNVDVTETFESTSTGSTTNELESSETGKLTGSDSLTTSETGTASGSSSSSGTDSSTNNTTMNSNNKHVESATPQSELSITASNIDSVSYADKVTWNKDNSTSEGSSSGSTSATSESETETSKSGTSSGSKTEDTESSSNVSSSGSKTETSSQTHTKKGNQGVNTFAHDLLEFRELCMPIIQKIIYDKRIQELFMMVY